MSLIDRRRHPRFAFHSRTVLQLAGRYHNGTLVEASSSGGLVVCEEATLRIGEQCTLIVFNGKRPAFEVVGSVVNVHYPLAGIAFAGDDQTVADALRRIIDLNLGALHLPAREEAAALC
jgi:hypothetical protein